MNASVPGAELFPEPVHYQRTNSPGWEIRSWADANSLLSYLEPTKRYFAVFTLPDDSYVQCYGSKSALTVELRTQLGVGSFRHWRFGLGPLQGKEVELGPAAGPNGERVRVDLSQVLRIRDARLIIRQFLMERTLNARYRCEDITHRFS